MQYQFDLEMKVRDYECDLQGIVNNANYQHYIEHTRHEFLTSSGISFARLHDEGIDPVVARITMAFKVPLRSGDEFLSKLNLRKDGIKYVFEQDVFKIEDDGNLRLSLRAEVETVAVINGLLSHCEIFDKVFAPYIG